MFVAVGLQVAALLVLAPIAGLVFGLESAVSLGLGAAVVIIPNGLFALRLSLHRGRSPESYPVVFLIGEFVKIGLTVALLVVVIKWVEPISWLALLTGLIVALKMPLFVPLVARPGVAKDKCPGGDSGGA